MEINLKIMKKPEPAQIGIRVNTRVKAGGTYGSADACLSAFLSANPKCDSYSDKCEEAFGKFYESCTDDCKTGSGPCINICNLGFQKIIRLWSPGMDLSG